MINEKELWWLAGILEGEGYFGYASRTQKIVIRMTDEDTMIRVSNAFSSLTGKQHCPKIDESSKTRPENKDLFVLQLTGENARIVMRSIVSLMSARRRKKIWQSLNGYEQAKSEGRSINILTLLNQGKEAA